MDGCVCYRFDDRPFRNEAADSCRIGISGPCTSPEVENGYLGKTSSDVVRGPGEGIWKGFDDTRDRALTRVIDGQGQPVRDMWEGARLSRLQGPRR